MQRIIILGGGISGLSLGYFLQRDLPANAQITIVEKSHRVGGLINTIKEDGAIFEQGPRSFRHGINSDVYDLIKDLDLGDKIISAKASDKFLYVDQALQKIPTSVRAFLFSPWGRKIIACCLQEIIKQPQVHDESVHAFFSRRFSPWFADTIADAMVKGIYAGDSHKLSLKACLPQLYFYEQSYGSVIKGMLCSQVFKKNPSSNRGIFTLADGAASLVAALENVLKDKIYYGQEILSLRYKNHEFLVEGATKNFIADRVISCLPAHALAPVVKNEKFLHDQLLNFTSSSMAVVNLLFKGDVIKEKGFGYLIPEIEKEKILGVVWDSSAFPHMCKKNQSLLTVMMGKVHHPNLDQYNENDVAKIASQSLNKQMGIKKSPTLRHIKIALEAIPQYQPGHLEMVNKLKKAFENFSARFHILGSSFFGVAVNDSIRKSKQMAKEITSLFYGT